MWVRFPKGAERITIERQEFTSEFVDAESWHYFRAPPHFAAKLLHLNMGFAIVQDLPQGIPEDLPKEDPERDNTIASLTAQLSAMTEEVSGLRSDLIAARQALAAREGEVANLRNDLAKANVVIQDLKDDAEDRFDAPPEVPKAASNGTKRT